MIRAYCNQRGNGIDPAHFHAYYEARGWMLGKVKMKDWRAAIITWEKNHPNARPHSRPTQAGSHENTFIPWDVAEVRKYANTREWDAYFRQMEYGLYVRMALLAMVLGKA